MGFNLDLEQMLGLPKEMECPKCGQLVEQAFNDVDVDYEGVNPELGKWNISCCCYKCEHEWKQSFQLTFNLL